MELSELGEEISRIANIDEGKVYQFLVGGSYLAELRIQKIRSGYQFAGVVDSLKQQEGIIGVYLTKTNPEDSFLEELIARRENDETISNMIEQYSKSNPSRKAKIFANGLIYPNLENSNLEGKISLTHYVRDEEGNTFVSNYIRPGEDNLWPGSLPDGYKNFSGPNQAHLAMLHAVIEANLMKKKYDPFTVVFDEDKEFNRKDFLEQVEHPVVVQITTQYTDENNNQKYDDYGIIVPGVILGADYHAEALENPVEYNPYVTAELGTEMYLVESN